LSNLTRTTNENGSVYIGYDNRYRVSSFSDPFYYGISYNYDTAGNRTKLKLNRAPDATYTYDAVNRLTNLADSANQSFPHSYDVVNRLTARSAPNGVTTNYAYDGLSRLTALSHMSGANTLIGNQYTYDDANNISSWGNTSGNHAYGYDLVDRLTSATNSAQPNENYTYDAIGNRTASHISGTYNYQPFNKLTSTATASYTYDNNGNLLTKTDSVGITTFTWNEENQLIQVSLPDSLTVNYKYDGLGRRIQSTSSSGASQRYVYDGQEVLLDLNADWSVATTYLNDLEVDDHLRQTSTTGGIAYYLADHIGSTAGLTDPTGNILEQMSYDSFGGSIASTRTRYDFTGRERDSETGLIYYRARWYDSSQGRFISEDPEGLAGGLNLYVYAENNPIDSSDPFGLKPLSRSRTRVRPCKADEMLQCTKICGPKGVQSCRVSQTFRLVRWKDGLGLRKWVDGPLSCSCNDCEDEKVPAPRRAPRRLNQPTMDELRMQELSAREMEMFWKKVLYGSIAGGTVVVAGPPGLAAVLRWLAAGGAAAVPSYAP
jgi:RHS repeat-associated protein